MPPFDLVKVLELASKFENKIAAVVGIILIVFLLLRGFVTSEYVLSGKGQMADLKILHDILDESYKRLQGEHERLKEKYELMAGELGRNNEEIAKLKARIEKLNESKNNDFG